MGEKAKELMEQIRKDRPTYTPQTFLSRQMIAEYDPEYLELFHRMHMHVVHENTHLPAKFKEIIISAVDAATGYERGLRTHLASALEFGATKEEIFEGLEAASLPAGIHVLSIALPILKEVLDRWEAKRAETARE